MNNVNFQKCLRWIIAFLILLLTPAAFAKPWSFGVMGDTQWTCPDDPSGQNPRGVPVSIIRQINRQFIKHGVKFVIQVGDLTENGNDDDIAQRASAARELFDAGIGFFPMRGNHETNGKPPNAFGIPAFRKNFPQTRGLQNKIGAYNFSSPKEISDDLDGMTYSFDYGAPGNNARFVIIDNWATPGKIIMPGNGYLYGYSIGDQQSWINARLDKKNRGTLRAFVFTHQPLIAENHQDSPFAGYTDTNPSMQNVFLAGLKDNGVKYYICGHDHLHQRSIISSPDGASSVQEIIAASNSTKFYTPKALNDPQWRNQKVREIPLAQELYRVGYYIYTVDGPRITVDYYSDDAGNWQSDADYPKGPHNAGTHVTPVFNFVKKETWGYSLNGKEFLVCQKEQSGCDSSYKRIADRFHGTGMKILDGVNTGTAIDFNQRPLIKSVNTGWTPKKLWFDEHPCDISRRHNNFLSDVLILWGIAGHHGIKTDTFVLSMSLDDNKKQKRKRNEYEILTFVENNGKGRWVNAVDLNDGGNKKFVYGPWKPDYELGAYGTDPLTHTAWTVINHEGSFIMAWKTSPDIGRR